MPPTVYIRQSLVYLEDQLRGMQHLYILENGRFEITPSGAVASASPGNVQLQSVTIMSGGYFMHNTGSLLATLRMSIQKDLKIHAGGVMNVCKLMLQSGNFLLDSSGLLTAHSRGYESGLGPGAGAPSSLGGTGAGHGGSGGSTSSQPQVGIGYGNLYLPVTYGSGGGSGNYRKVGLWKKLFSSINLIMINNKDYFSI